MFQRLHLPAAFLAMLIVASVVIAGGNAQEFLATTLHPADAASASAAELRAGKRLLKRVKSRFGFTMNVGVALASIREQRRLLQQSVTVQFPTDDGVTIAPFTVSLHRYPLWLTIAVSPGGVVTMLNTSELGATLRENPPQGIRIPADAHLLAIRTEENIERARTDAVAKKGYDFDPDAVALRIGSTLLRGESAVQIPLRTVSGRIINETGENVGSLQLLATGRSNFEGSGAGRKANVRKGLNEKLSNVFVRAGEEFSINRILKNVPINEWEMALGIFNGGDLRPVAGGGLCQVATTLYRSILNAGLPVTARSNHSLYVHYYEKYGVGIDATIFPSSNPDLRFVNDTGHPLLIQAYTEGDEATVSMYGTPDGRTVRMIGPYFATNAPEDFLIGKRKLSQNEIAWIREITYGEGRKEHTTILSRYKLIPRDVVAKYAVPIVEESPNVHAASPDETSSLTPPEIPGEV